MTLLNSLKNAFSKKATCSFDFLETDFHSHLLPGVDDGAKNVQDTAQLYEGLLDLGFTNVITTPHIHREYYPNIASKLTEVYQNVIRENKALSKLKLGAEYYINEPNQIAQNGEENVLCIFKNSVLIEFPFVNMPLNIDEIIFQLNVSQLKPIIAHPERYLYLQKAPEIIKKLEDSGCKFQLNISSVSGYYGKEVAKFARLLIKENKANYLSTDVHNVRQLSFLQQMIQESSTMKFLKKHSWENNQIPY